QARGPGRGPRHGGGGGGGAPRRPPTRSDRDGCAPGGGRRAGTILAHHSVMIVSRSGLVSGACSGLSRQAHSSPDAPPPGTPMGDFLLARPIAVVARVAAPGRGSIERVEALTPYA